ncbi:stage II sporulation protein E [Natranaerobius trueperi]|uniref:Stage II sporulation protein E n=1 Tax=Natranaerobius trueperi TaxID=759412 RepID=A0A226BWB9_9FIRM|nr:stage II sporulation protein E [Natranaerobius trueperi]OWZ83265.1 stage II sporulation protein E [Natranaerobius trueperi]
MNSYNTDTVKPYQRTYEKNTVSRKKIVDILTAIGRKLTGFKIQISMYYVITLAFYFFSALLLTRTEIRGGLAPLALAFLISLKKEQSSKFSIALTGTITGFFLTQGLLEAFILLVPIAIFQLLEKSNLTNSVWTRITILITTYCILNIIYQEYVRVGTLEVLPIMFEGVLALLFSILFSPAVSFFERNNLINLQNKEDMISISILIAAVFLGIHGLYIVSLSVQRLLGMILVLIVGFNYGGGKGAAIGTLFGTIISFNSLSYLSIGALAFGGLGSGIFREFGKLLTATAFVFSNFLMTFYLGEPYLIVTYLSEVVIATGVFLAIPKKVYKTYFPDIIDDIDGSVEQEKSKQIVNYKMDEFADLFCEIADIFGVRDHNNDRQESQLEEFVQTAAEKVCGTCSKMENCWEEYFFITYKNFLNIVSGLDKNKKLTQEDLPLYLTKNCIRPNMLISNMENVFKRQYSYLKQREKTEEEKRFLAQQLKGIGNVLKNLSKQKSIEDSQDEELEEKFKTKLKEHGYNFNAINIISKSLNDLQIEVVVPQCKCGQCQGEHLSILATETLGRKVAINNWDCSYNEDNCLLRLRPELNYYIVSGSCQATKEGESLSGDNYISKTLTTGEHLLLLSDGMGSGFKANQESRETIDLISKMLNFGLDKDLVIKSANSLLSIKNRDESFATVDLALVDLYTGSGEFYKAGAVSSYVLTKDLQVERVSTGALPAGIIDKVEPKTISQKLNHGDYIVLVSDGIYDAEEGDRWLEKAISELQPGHPQVMADALMDKVKRRYYGEVPDDITILVSKVVSKNSNKAATINYYDISRIS